MSLEVISELSDGHFQPVHRFDALLRTMGQNKAAEARIVRVVQFRHCRDRKDSVQALDERTDDKAAKADPKLCGGSWLQASDFCCERSSGFPVPVQGVHKSTESASENRFNTHWGDSGGSHA